MTWGDLKDGLKRTAIPLIAVQAGGLYIRFLGSELLKQQLGILAWKAVLVGSATVIAHFVRMELFPYVNASEALAEKTVAGSLQLLSMVIIYAAIILAVCSGL